MIRRIEIKNIRSIKRLNLSPKKMNIFIGKNSSGKSSIISGLLGLHALALGKNNLPRPFIDFEWLHRKGTDEFMEIVISGPQSMKSPILKVGILESGTFLSSFTYEKLAPHQRIVSYTVSGFGSDIKNEILRSRFLSILPGRIEGNYRNLIEKRFSQQPFIGYSFLSGPEGDITHKAGYVRLLRFEYTPYSRKPTDYEQLTLSGMKQYGQYLSNMVYISVTRGFLDATYSLRDELVTSISGDDASPEEILNIQAYEDHRDEQSTQLMNKWASIFGIEKFETRIQPRRRIEGRGWIPTGETEAPLPVALYGFGSNQFLIVIAKCVFAPKDAPILIEEPEIHLHPEMQAEAADFLIEMMKNGHQLFITTHSEHLITRIQRRIADRTLSPNDVGIFWVQFDENNGTIVERVKMNKEGILHQELKTYMEFLEREVTAIHKARAQNHGEEGE